MSWHFKHVAWEYEQLILPGVAVFNLNILDNYTYHQKLNSNQIFYLYQ